MIEIPDGWEIDTQGDTIARRIDSSYIYLDGDDIVLEPSGLEAGPIARTIPMSVICALLERRAAGSE